MADTPFHEEEPRLSSPNFYYAQEDELFDAAARNGFSWSVHRAHTVFGFAIGNAMNMVLTLSAPTRRSARSAGRRSSSPARPPSGTSVTDVTDADLLAEQMIWTATHDAGRNEAFNIANGDVFRWRWLWPQIADLLRPGRGRASRARPRTARRGDGRHGAASGADIAARHGLVEPDLARVASWWHTDGDLGRGDRGAHRHEQEPRRPGSPPPGTPGTASSPTSSSTARHASCPEGPRGEGRVHAAPRNRFRASRRTRCAP